MISERYGKALAEIKYELSKYSHVSVFNVAVSYLTRPLGVGEDYTQRMPWVVMLLLKHKFLGVSGGREITGAKFLEIANRVFNLSDHIGDLPSDVLLMLLRSMAAQQRAYQVPAHSRLQALMMQRTLLVSEDGFYKDLFFRETGVELKNYYVMGMYLFSQAASARVNECVKYSLRTFFMHLTPHIPPDQIASFLVLVGLTFSQIPAFLKRFEVTDSNTAELYQDSPFKLKPVLIFDEGLVIISPALYMLGIRSIVYEVMKSSEEFGARFGSDVESYLGRLLGETFKEFWPIEKLKGVINLKRGKKADFVIREQGRVLIVESKAIEPTDLMMCAYDPIHLRSLLSDSFLKGIEQGLETAHKLNRSAMFAGNGYFILVVTIDDFFISGGEFVSQFLDDELFSRVEKKYGCLPVAPEDVIYITLSDLVGVSAWLKSNPGVAFSDFITRAKEKVAAEEGLLLGSTLWGMLQREILLNISSATGIEESLEALPAEVAEMLRVGKDYWSGRHVHFLLGFHGFQMLLVRKLMGDD